jgi:hypothetical protein
MLLVIFGAGASYDSVPAQPASAHAAPDARPPLADELFANRGTFRHAMEEFPRCLAIIPWLQNLPDNTTVEHQLERFQQDAAKDPERHKQLMAVRWYLQRIISTCTDQWMRDAQGITNYRSLVDQIRHWRKPEERVCFVTFNYDRLLDAVMPEVGVTIKGLDDYIASDVYKLIKVHGSVDWMHEVDSPWDSVDVIDTKQMAKRLIEQAPELKVGQSFQYLPNIGAVTIATKPAIPGLAIPVETKTDSHFECPQEHLEALRAFLPQVKKILIIGWRGTEAHFKELLKENIGARPAIPVMVVSGSKDAAEATCRILRETIRVECQSTNAGFTEFIVRKEGEEFLKL